MASIVSGYTQTLKTLLDPITFAGSTLGTKKIIKLYQKSVSSKPQTEINIFGAYLQSSYLESDKNKRFQNIFIRVRCLAENREEQAQEDMNYLIEQIMTVLENNLNNANWGNGWLDNESLITQPRNFRDNYYTSDFPLRIARYATLPN